MEEKTTPDEAVVKFSHCSGAMLEMLRVRSDAAEIMWGGTHVPALFFTLMEDCRKLSSSMAVFVVNLHVDERCVSGTWSGKRPLIGKNATQQGSWTKHGMSDQDASQVSWRSHFESLSSVGIETNHSHRYRLLRRSQWSFACPSPYCMHMRKKTDVQKRVQALHA